MHTRPVSTNLMDTVEQLKRELPLAFEQVAERLQADTERQVQCILWLVQAQRLLAQRSPSIGDILEAERLLAEVAAEVARDTPRGLSASDGVIQRLRQSLAQVSGQRRHDRWSIWRNARQPRLSQTQLVASAK